MSKKNISLFFIFSLLLAGCDPSPEQKQEQSPPKLEKVSFRLAWVPDMAEVGLFVAKEYGYFEKYGLDVTIEPGGFGLDPIKLVASGQNDYGIAGAGNILIARDKDIPVIATGVEFKNTPVGFIVMSNSNINSFKDFKGKKVGVQTGTDTDVLYRALLKRYQIKPAEINEVPIQFDMAVFTNGLIDVLPGYITNQPVLLKEKGFDIKVISAASQGLDYYGNVFFTTETTAAKNKDQVKKNDASYFRGLETCVEQ